MTDEFECLWCEGMADHEPDDHPEPDVTFEMRLGRKGWETEQDVAKQGSVG